MITPELLIKVAPNSAKVAAIYSDWINKFSEKYFINSNQRMAAFLAQTLHESGSFKFTRELATGSAYEGRKDLGNIFPGDGVKFKGRGLIQVTGRTNYSLISKDFFGDDTLLKNPDLLAAPQYAAQSAFWYWDLHNLNHYADMSVDYHFHTVRFGEVTPFGWITVLINGGFNGINERIAFYNKITTEFGLPNYKPLG